MPVGRRPIEYNHSESHTGYDPVERLAAFLAMMADVRTALDAEIAGATLLASPSSISEYADNPVLDEILSAMKASADPNAAIALTVIEELDEPDVGRTATTGVQRLHERGVSTPSWFEEICMPVTVTGCVRLADQTGDSFVLAARFHRAGQGHAFLILIDPEACGEANQIGLFEAEELCPVLDSIAQAGRDDGLTLTSSALEPADFRWYVENAMDIRAAHDESRNPHELLESFDAETLEYHLLTPLLRARLRTLPRSDRPKLPHGAPIPLTARRTGTSAPWPGRKPPKLPPKRKTRDGIAPILRIRVDLVGIEPPIWRGLEVPGDTTLADLHRILQWSFDWDDHRQHVFDTDFGAFGQPDAERGQRSERGVTLEQVAAKAGETLTYTYDFGDDWEHHLLIEGSEPPRPDTAYPRCVGGQRAAPPEDCGGATGYRELLRVLADPTDNEHDDTLERLGLEQAGEFDAEDFDTQRITESLATLRRTPGRRR